MFPSNAPFGFGQQPQTLPVGQPAQVGLPQQPLYGQLQSDGGAAQQNQLQLAQPSQNGQGLQQLSAPDSVSDSAKKQALAQALMSTGSIKTAPMAQQANLSGIIPGNYVSQS